MALFSSFFPADLLARVERREAPAAAAGAGALALAPSEALRFRPAPPPLPPNTAAGFAEADQAAAYAALHASKSSGRKGLGRAGAAAAGGGGPVGGAAWEGKRIVIEEG